MEDFEWIFGDGVSATKVSDAAWLLEANRESDSSWPGIEMRRLYLVISVAEEGGRYLLNGVDVELDESVWGLGDELAEVATVLGNKVRLEDPPA